MDPAALVESFIRHIVQSYRLPTNIVTDWGSLFTSGFWEWVTRALGISRNLSTAFQPQPDGQTERIIATLQQYLQAYCNYQQDDW